MKGLGEMEAMGSSEVMPGFRPGEAEEIAYLFEAWRARQALEEVPAIVAHVRSLIGGGERGDAGGAVTVPDGYGQGGVVDLMGLSEESAPLRISAADSADTVYGQLVEWVVYWAGQLEGELPPSTAVAWRLQQDGEAVGFRAGTTVSGAQILTRLQTMWLLLRHDRIMRHPYGPGYVRDVTAMIWALKARYPMRDTPRSAPAAPCEHCGYPEVRVSWFHGEDRDAASVRCDYCGHVPGGPGLDKARGQAEAMRWLEQQRLLDPKNARVA